MHSINRRLTAAVAVTTMVPTRSARDLIGKKIEVNTLGAHGEAVTRIYLARNGPTPDEIAQVELVVAPPSTRSSRYDRSGSTPRRSASVAGKGGTLTDSDFAVWIDWLTQAGELKGKQVEAKEIFTNEFDDLRDGGAAQ